ncbi:MAG: hypothetical protein WCK57_06515 [Verrucomicrobiae bacterium]
MSGSRGAGKSFRPQILFVAGTIKKLVEAEGEFEFPCGFTGTKKIQKSFDVSRRRKDRAIPLRRYADACHHCGRWTQKICCFLISTHLLSLPIPASLLQICDIFDGQIFFVSTSVKTPTIYVHSDDKFFASARQCSSIFWQILLWQLYSLASQQYHCPS